MLAASYPVLLAESYERDLLVALLPRIIRANPRLLASGRYHLAVAAGRVVACGGWSAQWPGAADRMTPGLAHIRHFATHPDFARMGLGARLVDRSSAEARAARFTRLRAHATLNAIPFYAAQGFRELGREAEPMGPGLALPIAVMERAL